VFSVCAAIEYWRVQSVPFRAAIEANRRNSVNWKLLASGTAEESNTIRQHIRSINTSDITIDSTILFNVPNCFRVINDIGDLDNKLNKNINCNLYEQQNYSNSPANFNQFCDAIVFILNHREVTDSFFMNCLGNEFEGLFTKMQIISFANTNITDVIVPKIILLLQDCKTTLRIIDTRNTRITDIGLSILREAFPTVNVNPEFDSAPIYFLEAALNGTRLDFSNTCTVTDKIVSQFASLPVTHIILRNTPVTNEILPVLSTMHSLVEIDLQNTEIEGEKNMEFLSTLPSLHQLNLVGTRLSANGIDKLKSSRSLLYLKVGLAQSDDNNNNKNEQQFLHEQFIPHEKNYINDGGFSLFPCDHPLRILEINSDLITDNTLQELARLNNIQSLTISGSKKITDDGLLFLTNTKSLKKLRLLNTGITIVGVKEFIRLRHYDVALQVTDPRTK
jgi:hypothetical protein